MKLTESMKRLCHKTETPHLSRFFSLISDSFLKSFFACFASSFSSGLISCCRMLLLPKIYCNHNKTADNERSRFHLKIFLLIMKMFESTYPGFTRWISINLAQDNRKQGV
jgi:hypothetical protein